MTSARRAPGRVAVHLLLWGYAVVALLPLVVMLLNSLRPTGEIFTAPLRLPTSPTLHSYLKVWTDASFSTYFLNSLIVTGGAVLIGTAVSALAAYPLARHDFFGSRFLGAYFLAGLMLPIRLGLVPIFYLMDSMGLIDSLLGLTLLYAASGVPFCVFVLSAFYRSLPGELDEAARLDGAGEFRIFGQIMLPLVRPALASVTLFQFVPLWHEFLYPLVLLRSDEKFTIPRGLSQFFGEYTTDWSALFAGLVLATAPLFVLFVLATKQIIAGLTAGMSK
ncbi:carbohydrate ABC transporter permease [Microtetraspora malaysiensis]|uniref:carbohydrate ABC transporter permease n=1 Tax=Microtetraspora malaysiensis TaxID=161358 RepID=UPI00082B7482|nr:carbohydrate ABC transporter permease [Microtetraspora malaysiensis]